MKKFILLVLAVLFGSFLLSASAHALPTLGLMVENEFHFDGFSNLEDTVIVDGHATAGEKFWAIETISSIKWGSGLWQPNWAVEQLTSVMDNVFFPSTYMHPTLVSDGWDATGWKHHYAADDVSFDAENIQGKGDGFLKAYYDTSYSWDPTDEPGLYNGNAHNYAMNGNLWLELDVIHYQGHFDQLDIWYADDGSGNPDFNNVVAFSGGEGHLWGLLDLVNNYTGYPDFAKDSYSKYADTNSDGVGDTWLTGDFYLICDLDPVVTAAHSGWEYGTNNPLKGTPVPEPATMLLLGSGLIGMAGFGRKKLKK